MKVNVSNDNYFQDLFSLSFNSMVILKFSMFKKVPKVNKFNN